MLLSERLLMLRKKANKKQKTVADDLNLSPTSYQRYEYGSRNPSINLAAKIADYYDVSLDYLAGRTDIPNWSMEFLSKFTAKDDQERELLRIFRSMMNENQQSLLDYAKYMKMKDQDEQKEKENIG